MKEEYETIVEPGADLIGVSADSLKCHAAFCGALGGCPFPVAGDTDRSVAQAYGAISEDRRSGIRPNYVVSADLKVFDRIPRYQPGNVGQFMEIFRVFAME